MRLSPRTTIAFEGAVVLQSSAQEAMRQELKKAIDAGPRKVIAESFDGLLGRRQIASPLAFQCLCNFLRLAKDPRSLLFALFS